MRNEATITLFAWAHARKARVPFVVVMAIVFPATMSFLNSRGITQIKCDASGELHRNAHPFAFASEKDFGVL